VTPLAILAAIFAVAILMKLVLLLTAPAAWARLTEALMRHRKILALIYALAAILVGTVVFSYQGLIEVAAVMLFTSLLMGLAFLPYAGALDKLRDEVLRVGVAGAWPALLLWGALAVAVLVAVWRAA